MFDACTIRIHRQSNSPAIKFFVNQGNQRICRGDSGRQKHASPPIKFFADQFHRQSNSSSIEFIINRTSAIETEPAS